MWQPQGFYNEYALRMPIILSGDESVRGLFNYPASKVAVICGKSFSDEEVFRSTFSKKEISFFRRSWSGEPDLSSIAGTLHEIESYRPDTIIAVGGGSVIDGSKIVRLFYEYPFFKFGETRISGEALRTKFIAIPTTVGSGAEVSSAAVFLDHENHRKDMIVIHELMPEVVVYDKRYVEGTKINLLMASILDAMAHILEGYVSTRENAIMDVYAEKGFTIIAGEIEKIVGGDEGTVDFQRLQYAGLLGGLVQNHCIVGAAHAIAHQLTDYGFSHGEAVSLLLPSVIKMNAEDSIAREKYDAISAQAGFTSVLECADMIESASEKAGIHKKFDELKELLVKLSRVKEFRDNVMQDKGGKGNPIPITDEYIDKLVRSL